MTDGGVVTVTPLSRLVSWFVQREESRQRPAHPIPCAECGEMVGPDEGSWFKQWRLAACSEDCAFAIQSDRF
jgi:hypothetical protein